jgi:hypothetical protein
MNPANSKTESTRCCSRVSHVIRRATSCYSMLRVYAHGSLPRPFSNHAHQPCEYDGEETSAKSQTRAANHAAMPVIYQLIMHVMTGYGLTKKGQATYCSCSIDNSKGPARTLPHSHSLTLSLPRLLCSSLLTSLTVASEETVRLILKSPLAFGLVGCSFHRRHHDEPWPHACRCVSLRQS